MQNEQAKWILHVYRPGGQDASEPEFEAALDQARRDPELARWFADEIALDTRISAKLRQATRPPETLKTQLLALAKSVRPHRPTRRERILRWIATPALAAVLVLGLMLGTQWLRPRTAAGFAGYLRSMTVFVSHELDRLDFQTRELAEVRQWLASRGWGTDITIPDGLAAQPSLGCRLLEWNGHPVALICFALDERRQAHLLVIRRDAFPDAPPENPVQVQWDRTAAVGWSDRDRTYLLIAANARPDELLQLLVSPRSGSPAVLGATHVLPPGTHADRFHAGTVPAHESGAVHDRLIPASRRQAVPETDVSGRMMERIS